ARARTPDAARPGVLRLRLQPGGGRRPSHPVLAAHGRFAAAAEVLGGRPGTDPAFGRGPVAAPHRARRPRYRGPGAGRAPVPDPAQGRVAQPHRARLLQPLLRPRGARGRVGGFLPARLRAAERPMTSVLVTSVLVTSGTQSACAAAVILSMPSRPRPGKIAGPAAWPPPARSS